MTPSPEMRKICGCGRSYDSHAWKCLAYVGVQEVAADEFLELRNCECKSTLAIEKWRDGYRATLAAYEAET